VPTKKATVVTEPASDGVRIDLPKLPPVVERRRLADAIHCRIEENVGRARDLPASVVRLLNRASDVVGGVNAAATLVRESQLGRSCGAETMTAGTEDLLLAFIVVATDMLNDCFEEEADWLFDEPTAGDRHG
jgi:hypothetical protein